MRRNIQLTLLCMFTFLSGTAQAMTVLSSVKPINLIVQELTNGISDTSYLVPSGASPHDYALRPSDIRKVKQADVVIWYGNDLEPFLSKIIADKKNVITISEFPSVDFYHFDEHGEEGHSHEDGHHHSTDPHFWLGPKESLGVAKEITQQLIKIDPLNKDQYESNLTAFENKLTQAVETISNQLKPVQDKGYFVFHDAYGYFERYFGMNNLGHFTVSPDRKPGAKSLIKIKKSLLNQQAVCVFSEPQFEPAIVTTITRGTEVNKGELDPLAIQQSDEVGAYFIFLSTISNELSRCLSQ
ncbi:MULTISPECIES: zinc ABC transporter substrate-binding protein ZnuA [Aliivibrio]|uniref:High-affinity zinc uptake system protein ZnuA n=1 Tax=Aliivibrio finisterrensis TaxID=511998 RepID=A0A4Q5KUG3_9GAMM|nr:MULTISPECIES: zinc ABC transporter substrate-binding protein ZnuA [Aliivibrio]MDD9178898.1 zinc ABC transporter substrate-binding protein ZnuA [Aliivibrio sp. A6]RYU51744.1 zinc ABC transporter substrate-binding protein ZnuA [Aliivibrio finisterrensis]RYU53218.1 zinc ABC transporter substrate-binding protein ZnuA [Aliivibrio finisterrensis]RYU58676.1 zinc ABC transporter substrate-binding protein ZnuA [Aliivibrio finisterrensis]RYU64851.1 zinc ABC transporter substrate-binding protein ZnuA 